MKSGIYKILNKINGKFYIGSAIAFNIRWNVHKSDLRLKTHCNNRLQNSWNLHGEEAFEFIILEYCEKEKLLEREQHWMDLTQCYIQGVGYNLNKTAGSPLGRVVTEETRQKMSISKLGIKQTPEHIASRFTKPRSDEYREKQRIASTGRLHTSEVKIKISEATKGKKRNSLTEYHKNKISEANIGRTHSTDTCLKISNSKLGHEVDQETRNKISETLKKNSIWLCKDGSKCKCDNCSDLRKTIKQEYYLRTRIVNKPRIA